MDKTSLGDRMKSYEKIETQNKFIPTLPIMIRIDGRAFSKFTKPFNRPYDKDLSDVMVEVTKTLVDQTNAVIGYTQSDEISLIINSDNIKSQIFFNGRKDKILSVLAGIASSTFMFHAMKKWPTYIESLATTNRLPTFDCRAFNVPDKMEAVNCLIWREQDATKNAIQMLGQHHFSHNSLQGLSGKQIQEKLFSEKGINFNDEPFFFKRGSYVKKEIIETKVSKDNVSSFTTNKKGQEELLKKGVIKRNVIKSFDFNQLGTISNKVAAVFEQETPVYF